LKSFKSVLKVFNKVLNVWVLEDVLKGFRMVCRVFVVGHSLRTDNGTNRFEGKWISTCLSLISIFLLGLVAWLFRRERDATMTKGLSFSPLCACQQTFRIPKRIVGFYII